MKIKYDAVDQPWSSFLTNAVRDFKENHPEDQLSARGLRFKGLIFDRVITFEGLYDFPIIFTDCYFQKDINFQDFECSGRFEFLSCRCDQVMLISHAVFKKAFNLRDFKVKKYLAVTFGEFAVCNWQLVDQGEIRLDGGNFKELNIGGTTLGAVDLKLLLIDLNAEFSGAVRIGGAESRIQDLQIRNSAAGVSISIEDIAVNQILLLRYRNDKQFRMSNVTGFDGDKHSKLSVIESYLGKAEFYNMDFSSFNVVNIYSSYLLEASFVNVKWKTRITAYRVSVRPVPVETSAVSIKIDELESGRFNLLKFVNDPEMIAYYGDLRETFRQLKHIYGKQGDGVNEQRFHSREMMAFDRTISFKEYFWTKSIVWFSYWFSDFGQSVFRPLVALLSGHLILMLLFIGFGGSKGLYLSWSDGSFEGFRTAFERYFYYLNPLRKTDGDFKGFYILLDIMMRIWSSYMIYNIIRATRRFIK